MKPSDSGWKRKSSLKESATSAEENKTILLWFLDELKKGNLDIIDEVFSPNFRRV